MGNYFGTDGVRGIANKDLTPELAFKIGRAGGYVLSKGKQGELTVVIGKDTRISGELLENALISGLLSQGIEVMRLGVISTPGVAYLTREMKAVAGVMISASHNPFEDNGIKFFGADGFKLTDDQQHEIETRIDDDDALPRPTGADIGRISNYLEGGQRYLSHIKASIDTDLEGLRVAIDSAHGSNYAHAPYLFGDLEAETFTIGSNPNGTNINNGVGSTHPDKLASLVMEKECDFGLAFDGDGDRVIAVDEYGNIVDGDKIMYILGKHLKAHGKLAKNMIVSTVMSNLGFYKAVEAEGIESVKTAVGDRYVVEEMRKGGFNLGGEQSGHIILMDHNTTGDGLLTGVQLASVVKETGKSLNTLASEVDTYPQTLVNIRVSDKHNVTNNPRIKAVIEDVEEEMAGDGRVLVRASGTEPLVRVMVEAKTDEHVEAYSQKIATVVKTEMGI